MEIIVPTRAMLNLSTSMLLGLPYTIPANSTLNEDLGILTGIAYPPNTYPKQAYYAIGDGGYTYTTGADGGQDMLLYQHKGTDTGLFSQLPFVLRLKTDDLLPADRMKYALRKELTLGGITYVAYYLRRIDLSSVTVTDTAVSDAGVSTPLVPLPADLSPTPQVLSTSNLNVINGAEIKCSAPIALTMSDVETAEFINVATLLRGKATRAVISEIAFCTGYDKSVTVTTASGNYQFIDAIGVQVTAFMVDNRNMAFNRGGFNKSVDFGTATPVYTNTTV